MDGWGNGRLRSDGRSERWSDERARVNEENEVNEVDSGGGATSTSTSGGGCLLLLP